MSCFIRYFIYKEKNRQKQSILNWRRWYRKKLLVTDLQISKIIDYPNSWFIFLISDYSLLNYYSTILQHITRNLKCITLSHFRMV